MVHDGCIMYIHDIRAALLAPCFTRPWALLIYVDLICYVFQFFSVLHYFEGYAYVCKINTLGLMIEKRYVLFHLMAQSLYTLYIQSASRVSFIK